MILLSKTVCMPLPPNRISNTIQPMMVSVIVGIRHLEPVSLAQGTIATIKVPFWIIMHRLINLSSIELDSGSNKGLTRSCQARINTPRHQWARIHSTGTIHWVRLAHIRVVLVLQPRKTKALSFNHIYSRTASMYRPRCLRNISWKGKSN